MVICPLFLWSHRCTHAVVLFLVLFSLAKFHGQIVNISLRNCGAASDVFLTDRKGGGETPRSQTRGDDGSWWCVMPVSYSTGSSAMLYVILVNSVKQSHRIPVHNVRSTGGPSYMTWAAEWEFAFSAVAATRHRTVWRRSCTNYMCIMCVESLRCSFFCQRFQHSSPSKASVDIIYRT